MYGGNWRSRGSCSRLVTLNCSWTTHGSIQSCRNNNNFELTSLVELGSVAQFKLLIITFNALQGPRDTLLKSNFSGWLSIFRRFMWDGPSDMLAPLRGVFPWRYNLLLKAFQKIVKAVLFQ